MKKSTAKSIAKNLAKKIKGGPGNPPDKERDLQEVTASANVFKGPFSKIKAKRAIRKGVTDTAYAKKGRKGGREKMFKYSDSGTAVDLSKLNGLNFEEPKGTNKPVFMKKIITSSEERRSEKIRRANNN